MDVKKKPRGLRPRKRPTVSSKSSTPNVRAEFLSRHGISEDEFSRSNLSWTVLDEISAHHKGTTGELQSAGRSVVDLLQTVSGVHSLRSRVKDPEHLIAKLIRKKNERDDFEASVATYEGSVTDLVGVRALHLFKDDWRQIDEFVRGTWNLAEKPIVYVRDGDPESLFTDADCDVRVHPAGYRSVHYLLEVHPTKIKRVVELQVRTIFEDGWSEIDHTLRYPRRSTNPLLVYLLAILNRLAGSADEMGTLAENLSEYIQEQSARIAADATTLREKEAELAKAIALLGISNDEKADLKKHIASLRTASNAGGIGSLFAAQSSPFIINAGGFKPLSPNVSVNISESSRIIIGGVSSLLNLSQKCKVCGRPTTDPSASSSGCESCRKSSVTILPSG